MLIGFASGVLSANGQSDTDVLREASCDRVYSAEQGVLAFDQMMDYLRPGDVAVVTSLAHLGRDIDAILSIVSQLHATNIGLHVIGSDIVPGTPLGDSFPQACAILNRHQLGLAQFDPPAHQKARARGRPPVLTAETKFRIERLLRAGRLSVSEIAQLLDVSPATIYRHFPGGGQPTRSRMGQLQAGLPAPPQKR